ncbi:MAG: hypothetical protein WBF83_00990 [Moheibacter sp.]
MKGKIVFFTGFILSVVITFIFAYQFEQGDINAISMYYVVFLIPILISVILNSLYIYAISKIENKKTKLILSQIPAIILVILSLIKIPRVPQIDGSLNFVAVVGAIALGITNILWFFKILKPKH